MKITSNNPNQNPISLDKKLKSAKGFSIPKRNEEELSAYLSQLEEEGYGNWENESFLIPWHFLYDLLENEDHKDSLYLLKIPQKKHFDSNLTSTGSLEDEGFSISISLKALPENTQALVNGAIAEINNQSYLLEENTFRLFERVKEFASQNKNPNENRVAWAKIRLLAKAANSKMDHFLAQTIIVTPDSLNIRMNQVDVEGVKVVELFPTFKDAPLNWLSTFDKFNSVQSHYDVPETEGLVHVIIAPKVQAVLSEIKRMPGRRVSGARAEAFLRNPYALLGDNATEVIPVKDFEDSLADAGVSFSTFTAKVTKEDNEIIEVSLLIESTKSTLASESIKFLDQIDLDMFIKKFQESIEKSKQCCFWDGWELEIRGDTPGQLEILNEALIDWKKPKSLVKFKDVFDLSHYSDRVDGIGKEKPYYSPFITKNNENEGWFPENITIGIFWTPEGEKSPVGLSVDKNEFKKLKEAYEKANLNNQKTFSFGAFGDEIPVAEIGACIDSLNQVFGDVAKGEFKPPTKDNKPPFTTNSKVSLLLKPNIEKLDYEELRNRLDAISTPANLIPKLPSCLRPEVKLLDHQKTGIAWLQHLWSKSPDYCRGAVMADDMGLGKTLQLLTFIAKCLDENKKLDPILIIAPVSLLDNWESEIRKFFNETIGSVKTLYGNNLSSIKIPKNQIDIQLAEKGLTNFLKPNWLGDSKIVLTTYETMRDLEFSFAAQKWSVMVCDEAQKIKNPNAMVTRSAKKMNVRFKVACTGTPVENSLTDLWCLFDFIQPGLLGALNQFSTNYRRRPFEANTEEEKEAVSELRKVIEPQILRRTKANVAKDLPSKEVKRAYLPISNFQRTVYSHAIASFKPRNNASMTNDSIGQRFKNHLGLLHYLRQVCADPRPIGHQANLNETLEQASIKSPKISWLIKQIEEIQSKKEKVIIFTEFRDVQRLIQKYLKDRFSVHAEIINGDTAAVSKIGASRQQKIDVYQRIEGFATIILSPLAVGFGVNIQKANHVIHFTRQWNPAKEDQATDRAYRIGQTKNVYVYYPIINAGVPEIAELQGNINKFKTFDVKLDELLEWKRSLSDDMLNGTGDVSTTDFTDLTDVTGAAVVEDRALTIDDVVTMEPDTFEIFCSLIWSRLGYPLTIKTPQSGDGGIDVVALNGKEKKGLLIQCKTSLGGNTSLSWEAVKDVTAGAAAYCQLYPEINFQKICVTNSFFNSTAMQQAEFNKVELVDKNHLVEILQKTKISLFDLEKSFIQYL